MAELSAVKALTRESKFSSKAVTLTGKTVDLSKGFRVKAPDGTVIPFRPDTPLEKAKQWTKNFYAPASDFRTVPLSDMTDEQGSLASYKMEYKKGSGLNVLQFEQSGDGTYRVRFSKMSLQQKGTGLGSAMYKQLFDRAKKEGSKVLSDSTMTDASVALWRRFKELGYPIVEHPMYKTGSTYTRKGTDDIDAPLFEYDPLNAEQPALLRKQAE